MLITETSEVLLPPDTTYLKRISEVGIYIPPTSGELTLARAEDHFSEIDPAFLQWGLNTPGRPTDETTAHIYRPTSNGSFRDFFESFAFGTLPYFEQEQIIAFCRLHRIWLAPKFFETFFLFRHDSVFYVASVHETLENKLAVKPYNYTYSNPWVTGCEYRVIVPTPLAF